MGRLQPLPAVTRNCKNSVFTSEKKGEIHYTSFVDSKKAGATLQGAHTDNRHVRAADMCECDGRGMLGWAKGEGCGRRGEQVKRDGGEEKGEENNIRRR